MALVAQAQWGIFSQSTSQHGDQGRLLIHRFAVYLCKN